MKKSVTTRQKQGEKQSDKKEVAEISKKMEKIDIKDKEEKEIEKVLKESIKTDPEAFEKYQKIVFRELVKLKKRKKLIDYIDIKKAVEKEMDEVILKEVLDYFDDEAKIQYNESGNQIMML